MSEVSKKRFGMSMGSWTGWNFRRVLKRGGLALLLMVLGGFLAISGQNIIGAGGRLNEVRVTTFADWRVICPQVTQLTPECTLTSDVVRDTGGTLLTLAVSNNALSLTLPHGVSLDSGVGFTVAAEPMRVRPYETCTAQGCIALVTLDADTLKSLSTNMAGQVTVAVPGNPQPLNIPYSLRGFTDGYAELVTLNSRRKSIFRYIGL